VLGLVLSGGGVYGFLHVGVLQGLAELGIVPDFAVGTSAGALVAGLWAAGYDADRLVAMAHTLETGDLPIDWRHISHQLVRRRRLPDHLVSVEPLMAKVASWVEGLTVRTLPRRCWITATSLTRRRGVVFGPPLVPAGPPMAVEAWPEDVPLATAIRASIAVPGLFRPVRVGGEWLVDGGVVDDYPVDVAVFAGATRLIGVMIEDRAAEWTAAETPDLFTTALKSLTLMLEDAAGTRRELVARTFGVRAVELRLAVEGQGLIDFRQRDQLIALGLEAARARADALRRLAAA
jgi:NTE family protein